MEKNIQIWTEGFGNFWEKERTNWICICTPTTLTLIPNNFCCWQNARCSWHATPNYFIILLECLFSLAEKVSNGRKSRRRCLCLVTSKWALDANSKYTIPLLDLHDYSIVIVRIYWLLDFSSSPARSFFHTPIDELSKNVPLTSLVKCSMYAEQQNL